MAEVLKSRHHYVPRTYLINFGHIEDGKRKIWLLPKDSLEESKLEERNIESVAHRKKLYTMPGQSNEEKNFIENLYSENFENDYGTIYNLLTDPKVGTLTPEQRHLVIGTITTMFFRTTKLMNQHNQTVDRVLEMVYNMAKELGKDSFMFGNTEISIKGKTLEQLQKELRKEGRSGQVVLQLSAALALREARFKTDAIQVVTINDSNYELITSDNPVSFGNPVNEGAIAPFDPYNMFHLPISPKHVVTLIPGSDPDNVHTISRKEISDERARLKFLIDARIQQLYSEAELYGTKKGLIDHILTQHIQTCPSKPDSKEDISFRDKIGIYLKGGMDENFNKGS